MRNSTFLPSNYINMGGSIVTGVPQARWIVYFKENLIKIDDLGYPYFRNPRYRSIYSEDDSAANHNEVQAGWLAEGGRWRLGSRCRWRELSHFALSLLAWNWLIFFGLRYYWQKGWYVYTSHKGWLNWWLELWYIPVKPAELHQPHMQNTTWKKGEPPSNIRLSLANRHYQWTSGWCLILAGCLAGG